MITIYETRVNNKYLLKVLLIEYFYCNFVF